MWQRLSFTVFCVFMGFTAFGQAPIVNVGATVALPQGAFKQSSPSVWGLGLETSVLAPIADLPLYVGGNLGYVIYGKNTTEQEVFIDNQMRTLDVIRNNNIAYMHGLLRVQPELDFPIRPYGECMIGGRFFYTTAKVKESILEEALDVSKEFHDWTFSYGWAAGINIAAGSTVAIDLKLAYMEGSRTEYLDSESVHINAANELELRVKTARTPMFMPQVGVRVVLE